MTATRRANRANANRANANAKTETPVEETSVEETSVEETSVEETSVEETPVEETSVEETPVEETSVEETPVEETPDDAALHAAVDAHPELRSVDLCKMMKWEPDARDSSGNLTKMRIAGILASRKKAANGTASASASKDTGIEISAQDFALLASNGITGTVEMTEGGTLRFTATDPNSVLIALLRAMNPAPKTEDAS